MNESRACEAAQDINDQVDAALESLEKLLIPNWKRPGLPTGFSRFDFAIDGLQPGELIVIAARPSVGKTSLGLNIAEHVAVDHTTPVGLFSLEVKTNPLVQRLLCSRARVDFHSIRNGFFGKGDPRKLSNAADEYRQSKLFIDAPIGLTLTELTIKAHSLKEHHGIGLIVIDSLEHMASPWKRGERRRMEIAEISSGIKALAKELGLTIIVTANLKRDSEKRPDGLPHHSDLGKSKVIADYADVMGFLYRSGVSSKGNRKNNEADGKSELILTKYHTGSEGVIPLTFQKEFLRFKTCDTSHEACDTSHEGWGYGGH